MVRSIGALCAALLLPAVAAAAPPGKPRVGPKGPRAPARTAPRTMDYAGLDTALQRLADKDAAFEGQPGARQFVFEGVPVMLLADATHDRMRLLSPVQAESGMSDDDRRAVLAANFHTALDARYAVSDGVLFAAFLHPLGSLTEADLASAVRQVVSLVKTYGTTYSSGELVFPGRARERRPAPANDDAKTKI